MAQQTAMQMMLDYLKEHGFDMEYEMEMSFLDHEKEQIMMAFNDGKVNTVLKKRNSEQYYKETYNK